MQRSVQRAVRALFPLAAMSLTVAPAAAADLVVDAASGFAIEARINGQAVRLRVDPETSGYIILNAATVRRLGLRRSLLGSATRIGPVRLTGGSKVAEVAIGGETGDRRLVWLEDREAIEGADGLIGPADMPYATVTFTLGAPRAGEATFALPMEFERSFGLYHPLRLGAYDFRFQFSLTKPFTLATAAAGAALATLQDGAWAGEAVDQVIELGVIRPVRPLRLARPLGIAGFLLGELRVRTGDHRGNLALPPEPDADPDEVVVTGRSRQRAAFVVHVGRDRLGQCSSLVWDNRMRRLTLHCTNPMRPT